MNEPCFDRQTSGAVKGVALILMFIHHFFTFPEWYVPALSSLAHPWFAAHFSAPTRLCVRIFAILTPFSRSEKTNIPVSSIFSLWRKVCY